MRNRLFSSRHLNKLHLVFEVVRDKLGCIQAGLILLLVLLGGSGRGIFEISHKLLDDCKSSSLQRVFVIIV